MLLRWHLKQCLSDGRHERGMENRKRLICVRSPTTATVKQLWLPMKEAQRSHIKCLPVPFVSLITARECTLLLTFIFRSPPRYLACWQPIGTSFHVINILIMYFSVLYSIASKSLAKLFHFRPLCFVFLLRRSKRPIGVCLSFLRRRSHLPSRMEKNKNVDRVQCFFYKQ